MGMTTKEEDNIKHLVSANTHDHIMFFTNRGKVFQLRVWDIPEASRQAKGQAIINLLNIEQGELVQSILSVPPERVSPSNKSCIFMATKMGVVKKTKFTEYKNIKVSGLIAIKLDQNDELVWVKETNDGDGIMLVTHSGKVIRFPEEEVRATGRATRGVTGISAGKDDYVVAMETIMDNKKSHGPREKQWKDLLVVMEKGLGKRTNIDNFRGQHRAGKGIKVANITGKTGPVAYAGMISPEDEQVIISSRDGQIINLPIKNIPRLSRDTQGVILMRFTDKSDVVTTATTV
jgi:DNA gyrase subunit A